MANIDKLILKLNSKPKDFTWNELVKVLAHYGYTEIANKGKTGGSRRKFKNDKKDIINLHKPHPSNILLEYAIKQVLEKLK